MFTREIFLSVNFSCIIGMHFVVVALPHIDFISTISLTLIHLCTITIRVIFLSWHSSPHFCVTPETFF